MSNQTREDPRMNSKMTEQRLLSGKAASRYIGMSEQFLRKSRMDGTRANHTPGPAFVRIGRSVRYDIHDLDAWISEHRYEPKGSR